MIIAAACMLVYIVGELLSPWPLKLVVDNILLQKPYSPHLQFIGDWLGTDRGRAIIAISSTILLLAWVRGMALYVQTYLTSQIGYELVYCLRRELFHHLQTLSLRFHARSRSGELITKVTGDTKALRNIFGSAALSFPTYVVILLGMSAIMFAVNWQLSLAVFATLPPLSFFLFRRLSILKRAAQCERVNEGRMASRVSDALQSMTLLQTFGREKYEDERFDCENTQALTESVRTARTEAAAMRAVEIVSAVGQFLVVMIGAFQVQQGRMTPGDILIFTSYVTKVFKPVDNLVKLLAKVTSASVSVRRIAEVLEQEPELQDRLDAIDISGLRGEIVFEDVSFDYGDGKHVIRNISFSLVPGQRMALVGASGAGKSTIAALIPRLFDPQQGIVRIDGVDVRHYRRESLRRQIGVVLQDQFISGASIRDNILYGDLNASELAVIEAAKAAGAHDFVVALEHGYDTVLGERGVTLSGGQRQRLALARAFIRRSPILILDEPMTGLDVRSEDVVTQALDRLMASRTSLLITHDLSLASRMDWILMLENGQIVEQGTHEDLIAGAGPYARLYTHQKLRTAAKSVGAASGTAVSAGTSITGDI